MASDLGKPPLIRNSGGDLPQVSDHLLSVVPTRWGIGEMANDLGKPLFSPPRRLRVLSCDWGGCDGQAVAFRWGGNNWYEVCRRHLAEAPNGQWVIRCG